MSLIDETLTAPAIPALGEVWPVTMPAARDTAAETARAQAEALLSEANKLRAKAEQDAAAIRARAEQDAARTRAEAQRILAEAKARNDRKEQRGAFIDRWLPRVALTGAVGLTALGEYDLAHLTGFPGIVAALLPTTVDAYFISAIRRRRDIIPALVMAIAANALYHLAAKGLFGTDGHGHAAWWLVVGVASIAPIVVWRIHKISHGKTAHETTPATVAPAASETAPATVARPAADTVSPPQRRAVAASETPRETVRATLPATRETAPETPTATADETAHDAPAATRETATGQRETAVATPRETARKRTTAKPAATPSAPATLRSRNEQLEIVGRFVEAWDGPEKDLPLQPIADALGRSKPTASRLVSLYRQQKTA